VYIQVYPLHTLGGVYTGVCLPIPRWCTYPVYMPPYTQVVYTPGCIPLLPYPPGYTLYIPGTPRSLTYSGVDAVWRSDEALGSGKEKDVGMRRIELSLL